MIVEDRAGRQTELRAFALTDMNRWGYSGLRGGGGATVTRSSVAGIPALHRAVRLKAEAIAGLRLKCWTGVAPFLKPVTSGWQTSLFTRPANHCQTRFGFWETIGESLGWRNNAFIWKNVDPSTGRVVEWWALHPDQVMPCDDGYRVMVDVGYVDPVGRGRGVYETDERTIIHVRGHGEGGRELAPDPLTVFRDALAIPIARQQREASMWSKGSNVQLAVEFPESMSPTKVRDWREIWRDSYEGPGGQTTAVVGGGATIKPIGMTMEQAQWAASADLTVSDASRITGVPTRFLGLIVDKNVPLEQDLDEWLRFGLGPDLERIESHLEADPALFPLGGRTITPRFDTNGFVRGDLLTQSTIEHQQIQDGSSLIDEIRAMRGQDPLPDGLGSIPQIVPVGGAPNPNMPAAAPAPPPAD